jgi:rhodanese-related sulfurtransferase
MTAATIGSFQISARACYDRLVRGDAPRLLDVCLCDDYDAASDHLPGASWRDPMAVAEWADSVSGQHVIVTCVKGLKVSQAVAADLRRRGVTAQVLEGGIVGWRAAGLPTVRKRHGIGGRDARPSRWITRHRPKIDRIACPWLISRFIDRDAEFLFVEASQVKAAAAITGAIPYDVEGVELTHRGDDCTFDALIDDFAIADLALDYLRLVVRGADTARLDLAPEAAGRGRDPER